MFTYLLTRLLLFTNNVTYILAQSIGASLNIIRRLRLLHVLSIDTNICPL